MQKYSSASGMNTKNIRLLTTVIFIKLFPFYFVFQTFFRQIDRWWNIIKTHKQVSSKNQLDQAQKRKTLYVKNKCVFFFCKVIINHILLELSIVNNTSFVTQKYSEKAEWKKKHLKGVELPVRNNHIHRGYIVTI